MKAKASIASLLGPLVDHVVIIKENHTYDNYFGTFPNSAGDNQLGKAQNPPPGDPNHRHETWMKRDTEQRFRVQYSEADIPDYFALARQYTLCDHFFSEVAGPSTPSHLMLITADSRNQQSALQFDSKEFIRLEIISARIAESGTHLGELWRLCVSLHPRASRTSRQPHPRFVCPPGSGRPATLRLLGLWGR